MPFKTRPARPEDVDFLASLFLLAMRESISGARGYWDPAKENEQFRQQLELEHTRVIRAEDTDVGLVTARRTNDAILISTLCIAVGHQGSGIGTEVVRQLRREAASDGLDVELFVLKANRRAQALYLRLGFVEQESPPSHLRMRWLRAG